MKTRGSGRAISSSGVISHNRLSTNKLEVCQAKHCPNPTNKNKTKLSEAVSSSGAISHNRLSTIKLEDGQAKHSPNPTNKNKPKLSQAASPSGVISHNRLSTKNLEEGQAKPGPKSSNKNNRSKKINAASTSDVISHNRLSFKNLDDGHIEHATDTNNKTEPKNNELAFAAYGKPNRPTSKNTNAPPRTQILDQTEAKNGDRSGNKNSLKPLNNIVTDIKVKLNRITQTTKHMNSFQVNTVDILTSIYEWIEVASVQLNKDISNKNQTVTGSTCAAGSDHLETSNNVNHTNKEPLEDTTTGCRTLGSDVSRARRAELYKSRNIEDASFVKKNHMPDFRIGRRPLNQANPDILYRMITVDCKTPEEFVQLDSDLDKIDQINCGLINIDSLDVNKFGKVTITCENQEQKDDLFATLGESGYHPREIRKKNFNFALFGIDKNKSSQDVLDEMRRKDATKFEGVILLNRFNMNNIKDIIVFSCNEESRGLIAKQPHVHIGKKRFKLQNFIELIQCFKCSKFGHKSEYCQANKLSCPNCAGNHQLKDCLLSHVPKCSNCSSLKTVGGTDHSSWDVRCPYRKLWVIRQRTLSYG